MTFAPQIAMHFIVLFLYLFILILISMPFQYRLATMYAVLETVLDALIITHLIKERTLGF